MLNTRFCGPWTDAVWPPPILTVGLCRQPRLQAGIVGAEALDEAAGARRRAILGEVAFEERRAQAGIDHQAAVEELAAIFARDLVKQGDRPRGRASAGCSPVTSASPIIDREDVERLAVDLQEADLAGLAVLGRDRTNSATRMVWWSLMSQRRPAIRP